MGKRLVRIYTRRGTGVKLANIFGCSNVTVSNALLGRINSKLSIRIRKMAINIFGGVIDTNEKKSKIELNNKSLIK